MSFGPDKRRVSLLWDRITGLESQLEEKDEEIDQLRGRIEQQQSLLAHRKQCIDRLTKERDELRKRNAELTLKVAEISRRQSFSSAYPSPLGLPSAGPLHRSLSYTPTPRLHSKASPFTASLPSINSTPSTTPPLTRPPRSNSLTSPPRELPPIPFSPPRELPPVPPTSENEAEDSGTDYSDMEEEETSAERAKRANHKPTTTVESPMDPESANRQQRRSGSSALETNIKYHPPSNGMTAHNLKESGRRISPPSRRKHSQEGRDSNLASIAEERSITPENSDTKPCATEKAWIPNGEISSESQREDHASTSTSGSENNKTSSLVTTQWSFTSAATSSFTTSIDESSSEWDSSFEAFSPVSSPTKSNVVKSLPAKLVREESKEAAPTGQEVVCLSDSTVLEKSRSQESLEMEEEKDGLGDMRTFKPSIRERTKTMGALQGKHRELGRKNPKELKKEAAKLTRQNSFHARRGQRLILSDLELISPDINARIREMICKSLAAKYGGLQKATKAAVTIQRAYRQYKLRKRFYEIRKEASQLRKRALSMRDTRRRPSILRKRQNQYRKELSLASTTDPLLRAREAAKRLGEERRSRPSSRVYLLQQKKSDLSLPGTPIAEDNSENAPVLAVCEIMVEEPDPTTTYKIPGVVTDESGTNDEKKDHLDGRGEGLPSSFSTDELLTVRGYQRPLSIFSIESSISLEDAMLARPRMKRQISSGALKRKTNIGVNHFNRKPTKGIQYLVLENVLEDNPPSVAKFLLEQYGLSKVKIGEFVGEISSEFNMAVLESLVELIDIEEKPIDEALRQFQEIFRMPGEAQKIDKIMQVFALEFYKHNSKSGAMKSEDAAYMLSFAIMMLHTSLHNPSVRHMHRTTRPQWISMNRGCNDGENFPPDFLLEIYDRIQKTEFTTGHDHTQEVAHIERQIVGSSLSRLSTPQRRLVHKVNVSEVIDLSSRPSFKNRRHRRTLLMFSDLIIVCKIKRGADQFGYKDSFSLLNAMAVNFETRHYKNGVQIYSSLDRKAIFQCNCDSSEERQDFLKKLEDTIMELREMETERIAELGTSLIKAKEASGKHRLGSGAGDLMSTTNLASSLTDLRAKSNKGGDDFVPGVGDIAGTGFLRTRAYSRSIIAQSRDSGIGSQQTTPVASPSPTSSITSTSHSPTHPPTAHPSQTPTSPSTLQPPTHPPTSPSTLQPPRQADLPRAKSHDSLRVLTIVPSETQSPPRSPSAEHLGRHSREKGGKTARRGSADLKDKKPLKKVRFPSLSSPFRSSPKSEKFDITRRHSHSPPNAAKSKENVKGNRSRSPI